MEHSSIAQGVARGCPFCIAASEADRTGTASRGGDEVMREIIAERDGFRAQLAEAQAALVRGTEDWQDQFTRREAAESQLAEANREVERLKSDEATMKLSRMIGLGDPVRPDIHAKVVRQRDEAIKQRDELAAVIHTEDTQARRERRIAEHDRDLAKLEVEWMRPVYEAAVKWRAGRDRNIVGTAPSGGERSESGRALIDAIDSALSPKGTP